jgi:hypothetical protein
VAVVHELARLAAGGREAEPVDDVVEAHLEHPQQVLARDAGLAVRLLVRAAELLLEHAVEPARLLLLAELEQVLALADAPAPVLPGRVRTSVQVLLGLVREGDALAARLLDGGAGVARHA